MERAILPNILFPIGHLAKPEVRKLAKKAKLPVAEKKDSTGICFIGKRDFKEFLSQYIQKTPGKICTESGREVGVHDGLCFYTIGQRKGLNIGGAGDAWFVSHKDLKTNTLVVVQGENHPSLFSSQLTAIDSVFDKAHCHFPLKCYAKVRYRQPDQPCTITYADDEKISVTFDEPQRAVTLGQSVVFYKEEICLGGGVIDAIDG